MDADRFNRNFFTLENIQVATGSNTLADSARWVDAVYVRQGSITSNDTNKTRAFSVADLTQPNRKFAKFSFIMQGGFDGVNIFDRNESEIITALRKHGASVYQLDRPVDLLVGYDRQTYLLEVKQPGGKLTEGQCDFFDEWRGGIACVVRSVEEALGLIGIANRGVEVGPRIMSSPWLDGTGGD
jgi:hypothetical protein